MRISDWSSDVCSSDLQDRAADRQGREDVGAGAVRNRRGNQIDVAGVEPDGVDLAHDVGVPRTVGLHDALRQPGRAAGELYRRGGVQRPVDIAGPLAVMAFDKGRDAAGPCLAVAPTDEDGGHPTTTRAPIDP